MLGILLSLCVAAVPPAKVPSVAILAMEAKAGVRASATQVLTDALAQEIRASGAFSRVASSQDLQAALGFDRQKQLMNCDNMSCLAEIAGALNVDLLLTGSVGKLGESYVMSLRLLDARTGSAPAAVTERVRAASEEALLDRLEPMVRKLVAQLRGEDPVGVGMEAVALPPPLPPRRTEEATPHVEEPSSGPRWGLVGTGLAVGAASPLFLLMGAAALTLAGAVLLGSYDVSPYGLVPGSLMVRVGVVAGSGTGAAVLLVLAVALAAVGLGLLGAGAWLR